MPEPQIHAPRWGYGVLTANLMIGARPEEDKVMMDFYKDEHGRIQVGNIQKFSRPDPDPAFSSQLPALMGTADDSARDNQAESTDMILCFSGRKRAVNRSHLMKRSRYFEGMFTGFWSEAEQTEIELHDDDADALDRVLGWTHGERMTQVSLLDCIKADNLFGKFKQFAADFIVADKYLVESLVYKMLDNLDDIGFDLWECLACDRRLEEFVGFAYCLLPHDSAALKKLAKTADEWLREMEIAEDLKHYHIPKSEWERVLESEECYHFLEDLDACALRGCHFPVPKERVHMLRDLREQAKRICHVGHVWRARVLRYIKVADALPGGTLANIPMAYAFVAAPLGQPPREKARVVLHYDAFKTRFSVMTVVDALQRRFATSELRSRLTKVGQGATIHILVDGQHPEEWSRNISHLGQPHVSANDIYFDVHGRVSHSTRAVSTPIEPMSTLTGDAGLSEKPQR